MDQRIGDEDPDVGWPASGPDHVGQHAGVIAGRNEGKEQEKLGRLLRREEEHEDGVDEPDHRQQRDHDRGHVEHSFAAWLIEHGPSLVLTYVPARHRASDPGPAIAAGS